MDSCNKESRIVRLSQFIDPTEPTVQLCSIHVPATFGYLNLSGARFLSLRSTGLFLVEFLAGFCEWRIALIRATASQICMSKCIQQQRNGTLVRSAR